MSDPVFRLRELTYRYPPRRGAAASSALDGLSADLLPGVTGILGLSGSGKTTLLNVLGLLDDAPVESGRVTYRPAEPTAGWVDYHCLTARRRAGLRQTEFGFVLQSALLLPHLTCLENLAVPLALAGHSRAERVDRAEYLFRAADASGRLFALRHERPRNVSGGERQRVAVLRAVAHDPRVVFADEPFSSLDPRNTGQILDLLRQWLAGDLSPRPPAGAPSQPGSRAERTLLLVSHTVATTIRFANGRCLVVADGRAVHLPTDPPLGPTDDPFGPAGLPPRPA